MINANQAGDANYNAAPQVQQSFAVGKGNQTVSFTSAAPGAATVGGATYNVTATATSGLTVSFTIDASATSVCSIAGSTVSFIGAGTCVINANQAGDTNYNAASQVQQSFAVGKTPQTINVTTNAPTNASNGSSFDVAATATSGLPVTITTSGSCSGGDTDGDATIAMTSGSGTCSVYYDQAGDATYAAATQVQEDVTATNAPAFTSANSASFDLGFAGTFNITATGNPSTMVISVTGSLPTGVTLTDNGNGTASFDGTPAAGTAGVYNLVLTANNGVNPNATQNFTLTVRNGPGASNINSSPDTGDGSVAENEIIATTLNITQFTVEFSRDVYDPAGDSDQEDVTNPANYLLLYSATGTFNTPSCAVVATGGVVAPDIPYPVSSVTYSNGGGSGPFVATLNLTTPLTVAGYYRLFVCGTTSIVDAVNTNLHLAGDGTTPGTDFTRNFQMTVQTTTGGGGGGNANNKASSLAVTALPATGFAPNRVTALPEQPEDLAYSSLGDLWIEVPALGIKTS
ncbi:MAG: hypothetical protein KDF65_16680, partial [Anaerolineae bacterium]|nr:hypothetical protein [Anaerolineae bacterium]